tara:strand:+ start:1573 stop:2031 length:459 start_codon:yes stop_codon:yes gene_type:complete
MNNFNLLLIHESHLTYYNIVQLYDLRCKINLYVNSSNKLIVQKVLNLIDDKILDKPNGKILIDNLNNISRLKLELYITNINDTSNINDINDYERNNKLIELFSSINNCEKILDFEHDSMLTYKQVLLKNYLIFMKSVNYLKENILLCNLKIS